MSKSIEDFIAEARTDEALKLMKEHTLFQTDSQYRRQINMIYGRWVRNEDNELMGTGTAENTRTERNSINHAILGLAGRYKISGTTSGGGKQADKPPIVDEEDIPADAPRILFLASDPRGVGKLQMEKEFVKMQSHLGDNFRIKIAFEPRADTLTKVLLDERPNIVHFSGHGTEEMEGFNKAGIILQDRDRDPFIVPGSALKNMFRLLRKRIDIQVVLLNACVTQDQAKVISETGCYAIGMADEIPDNMAISFAGGFYLGLAENPADIPFAFEMAKNSLMMEGIGDEHLPQLFKDGEVVAEV